MVEPPPPSPPSSSLYFYTPSPVPETTQSDRPEIGGSFGGFIALVVVLAAVFILSCVGIFFLLRTHSSSPYARNRRRSRASHGTRDFTPANQSTFRHRIARLFGRHSGWIQAAGEDGDEWDASEERTSHGIATSEQRQRQRHRGEYPASIASSAARLGTGSVVSASIGSVAVELSPPSSSSTLSYPNPTLSLDTAVMIPSTFVATESPTSIESSLADEVGGDLHESRDDRTFSVQMAPSGTGSVRILPMKKFDNFTKFKEEGLSF